MVCVCVRGGETADKNTDWILRKIPHPKKTKHLYKYQKKMLIFKSFMSIMIISHLQLLKSFYSFYSGFKSKQNSPGISLLYVLKLYPAAKLCP